MPSNDDAAKCPTSQMNRDSGASTGLGCSVLEYLVVVLLASSRLAFRVVFKPVSLTITLQWAKLKPPSSESEPIEGIKIQSAWDGLYAIAPKAKLDQDENARLRAAV